jgi:iron complex transport system substrate-binding protein
MHMKKNMMMAIGAVAVVAILIVAAFSLGAFSGDNDEETPTSQNVVDMAGRNVTVPWNVTKIVAVGAGALRFVTYLDASDMVVAVEDVETKTTANDTGGKTYILAHPEYHGLPSCGPQHGGDAELIASAQPDVIFKTTYQAGDCEDLQNQIGVPVIALINQDIGPNIDKFYQQVSLIGKVLHKEERAEFINDNLNDTFADLNERTKDIPASEKVKVYVAGLAFRGSHGMDYTAAYYNPFNMTNANNVITPAMVSNTTNVAQINIEILPSLDPDVIFVDWSGYGLCKLDYDNNPGLYNGIGAFQNDSFYSMLPFNWYAANFDTILVDAYFAGKILFPEQFADIDMEEKADQIYNDWVGAPCYDKLVVNYGGGLQQVDLK